MKVTLPILVLAVAIAAMSRGCLLRKVDNPDFCCVHDCGPHGADGPVACAAPRVCDADKFTCVDPSNGGSCTTSEDCAAMSSVTPICDLADHRCKQCVGADGCTASAPTCTATSACGPCSGEGDCSSYATMGLGHCATDGANVGQCVACRDSGDCSNAAAPVCDNNACRACKLDTECASQVCDEGTGKCVAETDAIYVAPGGNGSSCTKLAPCGKLSSAMGQVSGNRKTILMEPGTYAESVTIDAVTASIHGLGAVLSPNNLNTAVIVARDGANLTIYDARLTGGGGGSNADGIRCLLASTGPNPIITLRRVTIDTNSGQGIDASSCVVDMRQSRVLSNTGGGVSLVSSDFTLVNNFIAHNGANTTTFGGVTASTAGATHVFDFNTVADNDAQDGVASGVICTASGTTASGNIVYSNDAQLAPQVSGNCAWAFSDIGPTAQGGTNNVNADPLFVNATQDDYHLMPSSPAKDAETDPSATLDIDIDGDSRPQGSARDMGADEVHP